MGLRSGYELLVETRRNFSGFNLMDTGEGCPNAFVRSLRVFLPKVFLNISVKSVRNIMSKSCDELKLVGEPEAE